MDVNKISIRSIGLVELTKAQLSARGITKGRRVVKIEDVNNPESPTIPLSQAHKLAGSTAPSRVVKTKKASSVTQPQKTAHIVITSPQPTKSTTPQPTRRKLTISDRLPGLKRVDPSKENGPQPFKSPYYRDTEGNVFSARQANDIASGKKTIRQAIIVTHKAKTKGDIGWRIPTEAFEFSLNDESEVYTKVRPFAQNDQINKGRQIAIAIRGEVHVLYENEEDLPFHWRTPLPTSNVETYKNNRFWKNLMEALPEHFVEGTISGASVTFFLRQQQKGERDKKAKRPTRKGR